MKSYGFSLVHTINLLPNPFYIPLLSHMLLHPQTNLHTRIHSHNKLFEISWLEIHFFVFNWWLFTYYLSTYFCIWPSWKHTYFSSISLYCTYIIPSIYLSCFFYEKLNFSLLIIKNFIKVRGNTFIFPFYLYH